MSIAPHHTLHYKTYKGVDAVYDPTAEVQRIGVADVNILVSMGHFPFGKKADGTPYMNACAGKKRDASDGHFAKDDKCDKCAFVFSRKFAKASHVKSCLERQQGKVRSHTKGGAKAEVKVSPKLQARFERYADNYGIYSQKRGQADAKRPAFTKQTDKVKEICDSKLGKTMVKSVEIVAQSLLCFKGMETIGETEPRVVEITLKEWFKKEYQLEGLTLYPEVVAVEEEEEDVSDGEDDFEEDEPIERPVEQPISQCRSFRHSLMPKRTSAEGDESLSELGARAQKDDPLFCNPSGKSVKRRPLHTVKKSQGFQSAEGWRCGCINWECGDYWCATRFDSKTTNKTTSRQMGDGIKLVQGNTLPEY